MRIIGGQFRGKQIAPSLRLPVRPTTDMAREGLFNILSNLVDFESIRVLDLFSGTGIISLEFASRGCRDVTSIDIHSGCIMFLKKTSQAMQLDVIHPIRADVFRIMGKLPPGFDIVFADPPFDHPRVREIPDKVFNAGIIRPEGWLILEHSSRQSFNSHPRFDQHRKYGNVHFTFMK